MDVGAVWIPEPRSLRAMFVSSERALWTLSRRNGKLAAPSSYLRLLEYAGRDLGCGGPYPGCTVASVPQRRMAQETEMKPFKAKTKTGEKWYVMEGSSLVEVAAADVPGIIERMEKAEGEEALAAQAAPGWRMEDLDTQQAMALAGMGLSIDIRFPHHPSRASDIWPL